MGMVFAETVFDDIQVASRGLTGTPATALHLLKSATPRARHLARTRRGEPATAAPTSLVTAGQVHL